MQTGEKNKRKT